MCVLGLGKVGLPLAAQYANSGFTVIGGDIAPAVVEAVNAGRNPIRGEAGLDEAVAQNVAAGRLRATTDLVQAVSESDVVVVIVPLLVDESGRPDFRSLDAATEAVGKGLHQDQLVVYETTLPVTTTRRRFGKMLEELSGLSMSQDFWLAFSPERVYSGRILQDLQRYPKIVGGVDPISTRRAAEFYRQALGAQIIEAGSAEEAEFVKLIETTYRDVNIALANEFAMRAHDLGIDVTSAIRAANTQPFSHIHSPGVGVGGHCIPVYPHFLMDPDTGGDKMQLPRLARQINDSMPDYAVEQLGRALDGLENRRVLILGLAYRGNVKESAFSATLGLIRALKAQGAQVLVNDPYFTDEEIERHGVESVSLDGPVQVDAVVLQSYHDEYRSLDFSRFVGCKAVVDGRNVLERDKIESAGMNLLGIGR